MGICPDTIKRLVDRFNQQSDHLHSPDYNETLIRIDFIDPLMHALGWDINNAQGFAEQYREVVHEDKVKVGGQTKAPDYSFRIGGVRKFFLEAKKPAVNIKENWEPAYQLRRYAWSAKLAVSLLTDFEEFAVYDARLQPKQMEKASVARREFFPFTDYEAKWDFLAGTFSKGAVLRGDFDRYCESKKGRGAALFDDVFLTEIEEWRKALASNLALRNDGLDEAGLNFAVQRIIDRIIFLRIAEDRGTETVGQLRGLLNGEATYERLKKLFHDADVRYNSGLFHFVKEKDREESPDSLTPALVVDDKTLKDIIRALYYPQSPYEFTMVSADILGSVYERFLGKVITLTSGHRAKIEEKPEVRKAGGVYYTPTYIVDYIVKNTVGKLLGGETPPAAGTEPWRAAEASQSDALQQETRPTAGKKPWRAAVPAAAPGLAVEASQSDALQQETRPTAGTEPWRAAVPAAAPGLAAEASQSDALQQEIRPTVGKEPWRAAVPAAAPGLTPKEAAKLKILDPACGSGSFLIGAYQFLLDWYLLQYLAMENPALLATGKKPVLRPSPAGGYALTIAERKRILLDHIHGVDLDGQAVEVTKLNLLLKCLEGETSQTLGFEQRLFRERALPDLGKNILCGNSLIGTDIIGTDAWNKMSEEERTRVNPFDYERAFPKVFKNAGFDAVIGNPPYGALAADEEAVWLRSRFATVANSLDTFIMFVENAARQLRDGGGVGMIIPSGWVSTPSSKPLRQFFLQHFKPRSFVSLPFDVFEDAYVDCVVFTADRKRPSPPAPVDVELVVFPQRYKVRTPEDFASHSSRGNTRSWLGMEHQEFLITLSSTAESALGKVRQQPHAIGEFVDLKRGVETYTLYDAVGGLAVPRRAFDGVLQRYLLDLGPKKYLDYTPDIEESKPWAYFSEPRILLRQVLSRKLRLQATYTTEAFVTSQSVQSMRVNGKADLRWLTALLNSRLLSWYFVKYNAAARRDDFPKIVIRQTKELPVPAPTAGDSRLTSLVDTMLTLHKKLPAEQLPQRREQIQREIDAVDRQIDQLVYQLYGLTADEIRIVEQATI